MQSSWKGLKVYKVFIFHNISGILKVYLKNTIYIQSANINS